ncbi:MAG TPA: dienelactone hydrolase family protein [Planctomycetaceae bacterium]|nr:dienelactone hydrolase family protein [Planctomycetaceae bacterium]
MTRQSLAMLVGGAVVVLASGVVQAAVQTKTVDYEHDGATLQGFFAWDDAVEGKRPGVLVVHEWWGLDRYARSRAEQLAKLGYVAFALDMYGKGKLAEHPQDAMRMAGEVRANQETWRKRALAGLEVLKGHELVDGKRLAAIGYCFGGSTVLQLAYAGADLDAGITFHAALPAPGEEDAKNIRARLLICHGAEDSFIPEEAAQKFRAALDQAGADYEMIYYAGARHSFTVPDADARGLEGIKYDEDADLRSWRQMQITLREAFGGQRP